MGFWWSERLDDRFTSLRGSAALTVLIAHYQNDGFFPNFPLFRYAGRFGLFLFFFMSAFLLSHSLRMAVERKGKLFALAEYTVNRLFRILPLLALVVVATRFLNLTYFKAPEPYITAFLNALTLGQAPNVLWTIPVEMTFYAILPILFWVSYAVARRSLGTMILVSGFTIWCVAIFWTVAAGFREATWVTLGFHWYANSFVGGVLFYVVLLSGLRPPSNVVQKYLEFAPILFVFAFPFFYSWLVMGDFAVKSMEDANIWYKYYDLVFPLIPLLVAAIFMLLLSSDSSPIVRLMQFRPMAWLGQISFGVYLVHIPVLDGLKNFLGHGQLVYVAAIALSICIAAILHISVEKPMIRLGHTVTGLAYNWLRGGVSRDGEWRAGRRRATAPRP